MERILRMAPVRVCVQRAGLGTHSPCNREDLPGRARVSCATLTLQFRRAYCSVPDVQNEVNIKTTGDDDENHDAQRASWTLVQAPSRVAAVLRRRACGPQRTAWAQAERKLKPRRPAASGRARPPPDRTCRRFSWSARRRCWVSARRSRRCRRTSRPSMGARSTSSIVHAHRLLFEKNVQSVDINEAQGNPSQTDINYRGFTASPLLGTPQGLSVFLDGVRINEPFGDVVNWDLIPQAAISTIQLIPGSNPTFGLNTLGGAIAVTTKNGR